MPDHLHFMICGRDPSARPKLGISEFKQQTGYWFGRHAPHLGWQDDFYDHIVRRSEDWCSQVRYIAGNPVRAGLVVDPLAYPFTGSIGFDLADVLVDAND
jgi:REP element-mobilizing transposase RayT